MKEKQPETEDIVKLKPILGIRPGVYLTVLYSIILVIILFFLLVYPGLSNPGAVLTVKTEPAGAAIRVNGVYMGTSSIPIPKGIHTIEAVLPGFETSKAVYDIPGRIFGSNFFPLKYHIEFTLKTNSPADAFAQAAAEFAAWSFGGEPTSVWQIPLSLSEGAYHIGPANDPAAAEILTAASRYTVTRAALRDLIRAKILLDNSGISPSPAALTGSISDILVFLSQNPGSAQWLSGLLPPESASLINVSNWYRNEHSYQTTAFQGTSTGSINFSGLTFLNFSGFMISETPVSKALFETFLNENPEWKEQYTDYFEEEISTFPQIYDNEIITGITWYAAGAFCEWLSGRLPSSLAAMEVRLPKEAEWEYAAQFVRNMENPGWEWCAEPYAPLRFITASPKAIEAAGSSERVLRGRPASSAQETRTSLPAELSSPFVTFRLVIAQKAGE